MARVNRRNSVSPTRGTHTVRTGGAPPSQSSSNHFEFALETAATSQLREHMQSMLNRIVDMSDRLTASLSRDNLDQYRDAVSNFLSKVIDRSVQLRKDLREGNLLSVKVVNASLERLGNLVLEREEDRLKILDELGEIKGLLVSVHI